MRVLALDTTTRAGSVAIVDDGRVIAQWAGPPTRAHAERLPNEMLDLLATVGGRTTDVDLFAVASGPGSFTGLRIGIATVQGLAFVHKKRVAAVSALRALAEAAALGRPSGTRVAAWMDAHRHDVFSALYEVASTGSIERVAELTQLEGPWVGRPSDALARWATWGEPQAICGDGATMYAGLLSGATTVMSSPPLAGIVGRLALALAAAGETVAPSGLQPLYVRRPDAEVLRDAARLKR